MRNTFVEVLPAQDLTPSINNPERRRSSSAPPHEAKPLDLGVMVFNGSSSNPVHVSNLGAPGAMSFTANASALSEALNPTTSPATLTSVVRRPLADVTNILANIFALSRQPWADIVDDPEPMQPESEPDPDARLSSWPFE